MTRTRNGEQKIRMQEDGLECHNKNEVGSYGHLHVL